MKAELILLWEYELELLNEILEEAKEESERQKDIQDLIDKLNHYHKRGHN